MHTHMCALKNTSLMQIYFMGSGGISSNRIANRKNKNVSAGVTAG